MPALVSEEDVEGEISMLALSRESSFAQVIKEEDESYSLNDVIMKPMTSLSDIQTAQYMMKARGINENCYKAFYPLRKLKGSLQRTQFKNLTKSMCLLHLKPIEGALKLYTAE